MSASESDPEEPLDPAVERVRRKLVRLLMVSSGVMVLGFAAVVAAVVYRVSRDDAPATAEPVDLPVAAAALLDASVDGDTLVLTIGGEQPRIEVRRLTDGAVVAQFNLTGPPPE